METGFRVVATKWVACSYAFHGSFWAAVKRRSIEMKSQRHLGWVLTALLLVGLGTGSLVAQDGENAGIPTNVSYPNNPDTQGNPGNPSYDPPARVARIQ